MSESESDELTESVILPTSNPLRPKRRPFAFLAAPRAPDELGRLGDYRVLRLLGTGGMGFVFEAEELALRRRVALKVLKPELVAEPENRERFLREARAAAAIDSDHVVTIFQVADGEVPYLAMPFLEGESLQDRIERSPPVTLYTALEVGRQTAEGLAAAHAKGLIHRDIKPANLWLERPRGSDGEGQGDSTFGRVKILDFGLARQTVGEASLTSTGFIVGTPHYMAPEQAAGHEVDGRADLFSLGCVLYTVLAGELPFPGASAMAVMMALANQVPPPVNTKNPAVPPAVADLVGRMLEKEPERRPQSAQEVVAALGNYLAALSTRASLAVPFTAAGNIPTKPRVRELTPVSSPAASIVPPVVAPRPRGWGRVSLLAGLAFLVIVAVGVGGFLLLRSPAPIDVPPVVPPSPEPILVGVLHSQSGTMALSETPIIDATVLAIEDLNAAGGVLGRPVQPVIVDGKSDSEQFQAAAERLIRKDRVSVIFGCMMSPSRKAVRPVVERDNNLLFYPVSYEGLEHSPRIIYIGSAPNQKFLPGVDYLVKTLGKKRLFYIGSDLVSPRSAAEVVRDHLKKIAPDAEIVGTAFIPLGSNDLSAALDALVAAKPDAIINVLNGSSNFPFYKELRKRGIRSAAVPVMSIALTENDLIGLDPKLVAGDYLAANYFQTIDRVESRTFIRKLHARYGDTRVVTDNMVAAYTGVHIWAKAVTKAGTPDPAAVAKAVKGVEYNGPGGLIKIDPDNQHSWRPWRLGQIQPDGTVKVVAESTGGVRADPFPATRTRAEWERLLTELYIGWGGKWQAPPKP